MTPVERGEDAEVVSGALDGLTPPADSAGRTFWVAPTETGLPAEPATEKRERNAADGNRVLRELRMFHLHGQRPAEAGSPARTPALPALLHPYRDLSRVRYEFPILLHTADATARPLSEVMDDIIDAVAEPGDGGLPLRHGLLRLEAVMRSLVESRDGDRLALVWDRAAATLFETTRLSDDKAAALRENLARARKELPADGDLIACGPHTPARVFASCASAYWAARCEPWREELDTLIRKLENILVADFDHSEEAKKPAHLRETLGASDEMDVQAMSSLLRSAPLGAGLPEERRARVKSTIATLRAMQPVFGGGPGVAGAGPIRPDEVYQSCSAARVEHEQRMRALTLFFKSVRVARLEIQNHYRDAVHNPFFEQFGERHLTVDEIALCPPVLVRLTDDDLAREEANELFALLNSTDGIKILLELRNLYSVGSDTPQPSVTVEWPARLTAMAMGLNHAFVTQAPVSRAGVLHARMLDGLRQPGPALFCVGAPAGEDFALPPYLAAAAATESRLLPVVTLDPSRGATLAERISLGDNPQNEHMWPVEGFAYRNAAGEDTMANLAFTPADFFFGDPRLAEHFCAVPAALWHDAMLPLHELLELPANEAAGRIPYIVTVDGDDRVGRVVVSRVIVDVSHQCRTYWRGLRESGGVENSFAGQLLAAERDKLSAEKEREIEDIEKNYVAQLEQDVGELTREIVQRIAAQLLGNGATAVSMPMPATAPASRPAAAPAVEASAAAAAAPEEDDTVTIDDAYIDTPLCTSCNECTQLNSRIFVYNSNKQAEIQDAGAGPFSDIVRAAELCPVHIIHPGKPANPGEAGLDEWIKRAQQYN